MDFKEHVPASIPSAATSCSAARAESARPPSPPPRGTGSRAWQEGDGVLRGPPGFAHRHFQARHLRQGPRQIMDKLWAQEIDADSHIRAYQQEIRQKILDMYGLTACPRKSRTTSRRRAAEPAMEESRDLRRRGGYRGHAGRLRLLHLRSGPPRPRALLPVDGQGLRRVDQQGSPSCARRCASTRRW